MTEQIKKKPDLYIVHLAIMFVCMFGIGAIPAPEPITPLGMRILGIFVGMLWGWTFLDMVFPCLFGVVMVGFTGIMNYANCKEVFMAHFNNDNFIFIIFILIFVGLLMELNVVSYVANWIVSRKFLRGKPWLTCYFILLGVLAMGMIAQPFPAIFFFWEVLYQICGMYGYEKKEKWPTLMLIGVSIAAILSMVTCPYRAFVVMLMTSFTNATGSEAVSYLQYFAYSLPITLILLAAYIFTCKYIFKVDVSKIADIEIDKIVTVEKASYEQKIGLTALFVFLIMIFVPTILPDTWAITMLFNKIGNTGICILAIAILLLVRHNGKRVIDFQSAASKGVGWEIVIISFVLVTFTGYLTNASTGISAFLNLHLGNLLGGLSPLTLMIVLTILAAILTNFANNVVVGSILIVIGCTLGSACGANLVLLTMMITFGCTLGFLTPAATPYIAVAFANQEWINATDIYKYGSVIMAVFLIVFCVLGIVWGSIVF